MWDSEDIAAKEREGTVISAVNVAKWGRNIGGLCPPPSPLLEGRELDLHRNFLA